MNDRQTGKHTIFIVNKEIKNVNPVALVLLQTFWKKRSYYMDRVKRIWYLSPMRAAKVQASLRIRAVSPEPPLLAHTSSESRGTFRQKVRSLAPLNGWACAVKICHDGMLEDTNSLDGAHIITACKYIGEHINVIKHQKHLSLEKMVVVFLKFELGCFTIG